MAFLKSNGIRIFVGAADTMPTAIGFGADLDGDGRIIPGRWVDVNQDGRQQWFEVEDQFDNGQTWDQQPAAYNHRYRLIFISARVLNAPDLDAILKHEISHAIDCCLQDDPHLGAKWQIYIDKLYNTARRQGAIAFDESDRHEYFAQTQSYLKKVEPVTWSIRARHFYLIYGPNRLNRQPANRITIFLLVLDAQCCENVSRIFV